MMDIVQYDWQNIFGRMMLWGVIIMLIFVPGRFVLPYIIRKKSNVFRWLDKWKLLQLIVWIFYLSWFLFLFAGIGSWFTVVMVAALLGLIYLLYRYWLADLVAGILFRNQYSLSPGDIIQFKDLKGKVIRNTNRFIEIENQEGFTIYIPYSKIQQKVFMKTESKVLSSGYSFDLIVESTEEFHELAEKIKEMLFSLPWVSLTKEPMVTLREERAGRRVLTVSVAAVDRSFTGKIEQHMKKVFEKEKK